jgi:hypothetical protein
VSGYTTVPLSDLLAPITIKDSAGLSVGTFGTDGYLRLGRTGFGADVGVYANGTMWFRTVSLLPSSIFFPANPMTLTANSMIMTAQASNQVPVTIRGLGGQSVDTFRIQNSTPATLMSFTEGVGLNLADLSIANVAATSPFLQVSSTSWRAIARTDQVPFICKGMASQTVDLQQWQDSGNNVLASVDSLGTLQGRYLELTGAGTPGVTVLAAAGTGATASMVSGSTDTRGTINLTTGTGATGGDQLTFTFAATRPNATYCVLTSFAGNFQGATFTAKGKSTTAFTLASSGLTASTAYQIDYLVIL